MDAQARKKAVFRAKLNAKKKLIGWTRKRGKRQCSGEIERKEEREAHRFSSPKPFCRVCDIVLKSKFHWDAHQVSRKHHEAINTIKANAAGLTWVNNVKAEPHKELIKPKSVQSTESHSVKAERSTELPKNQSSSMLPPNFFDNNDTKMLKTDSLKSVETDLYKKTGLSALPEESSNMMSEIDRLPNGNSGKAINIRPAGGCTSTSEEIVGSKINQAKGALPEGFFDNKDADLRAHGIKPVKPDIKDEYKEFEKLIQEDLQEVDDRFEEEEIDAAETIEEAESVEQKTYWEKVEMLKKKKLELQVARPVKRRKASEGVAKESRHEESSCDDDSGENFAVDWRAQHL